MNRVMKCMECDAVENIQLHHPVPRSRGGTIVIPLCGDCHAKAHHMRKNMQTSILIKEALAAKKARGERMGRPFYGAKVCPATNKLVPFDEELQWVSAVMFLRERHNLSFQKIAAKINASAPDSWSHSKVRRIVHRYRTVEEVRRFHKDGILPTGFAVLAPHTRKQSRD